MKRITKLVSRILVFLFIITLIPQNNISAAADSNYIILPPMKNVEPDKKFEVKFNKDINIATIGIDDITVLDYNGKEVFVKILFDEDEENADETVMYLESIVDFKQGKTYELIIDKYVYSKDGEKLSKGIKMEFMIKNLYAGLPAEEGLIIIGNNAYSVDYLAKHSALKNQIMSNGYHIYYCYEPTKQKIIDIMENYEIDDLNAPHRLYDEDEPIVYTDENGNEFLYEWDEDDSEFKLIDPYVETIVTVNSRAKVILIKVQKAKGVDGAKYFQPEHSSEMKEIKTYGGIDDAIKFVSSASSEKVYILASDKTILGETTILTTYSSKRNCKVKLLGNKIKGNTSGNINNNGYAANDSQGYVLYNNPGDDNRMYKQDANGMYNKAISDDNAQYINVVEDWAYYSDYSDKGKLYRVKTDGSHREKLTDDLAAYVTVSGQWIYYSNHSDGGRIYRIKKDGSDVVTNSKGERHGKALSSYAKDEAAYINVSGEWIYYANVNDKYRPYVINEDVTYKAKLSDEWANSLQVSGDWIYYSSGKGILSKVKKDGSGDIIEIKGRTREFDKSFHINVVGDWIYYSNYSDDGKLYKIATNGTGAKVKLSDHAVTYINIVEDYIYYLSKGNLYKLPLDANRFDKPELIAKSNVKNEVVQMDSFEVTVPYREVNNSLEWLEEKYLPDKVPGILDDNTMHQLVVVWDKEHVDIKDGVRIYTGKAIGYKKEIKLNLIIPSEMFNETTTIAIFNNPGSKNDEIHVYNEYAIEEEDGAPKLEVGDMVRLYDDEENGKVLGDAEVKRDGIYNKAIIDKLELNRFGQQKYWVSVIREGKTESKRTEVEVCDEPTISSVEDMDEENIGITVADFKIREFRRPETMDTRKYRIYIVQNAKKLNLSDEAYEYRGNVTSSSSDDELDWDGEEDKQRNVEMDSEKKIFKKGSYDLVVAAYFETKGTEDNRGKEPEIIGWVCSPPATVSGVEEVLPDQPKIKEQIVSYRYGDYDIDLGKAPAVGEKAYLIPVEEDDLYEKVKGWRSEYDGYLEFTDDELNKLEYMKGDGDKKLMSPPKGSEYRASEEIGDPDYCPDVEYKLFILNTVGSSKPSGASVIVDNRPPWLNLHHEMRKEEENDPEFDPDTFYFKVGKDLIEFQSKYENAEIYIVDSRIDPNHIRQDILEDAYDEKRAYKLSVKEAIPYDYSTSPIKGAVDDKRQNYNIIAVDEVGNISKPVPVTIWVDLSNLEQLVDDAKVVLNSEYMLEFNRDTLSSQIEECEDLLEKAESNAYTDIVTQSEIDDAYYALEDILIDMGLPANYIDIDDDDKDGDESEVSTIKAYRALENLIDKFKSKKDHDLIVDKSQLTDDIWLITKFKASKYSFNIEWASTNEDAIDENGRVTRSWDDRPGDTPVELIAKPSITINSSGEKIEMEEINYYCNVRGKTFDIEVDNPPSQKITIIADGVEISDITDIEVEFKDDIGNWSRSLEHEGIEFSVLSKDGKNGLFTIRFRAEDISADSKTISAAIKRDIRVTIDGISFDNKIRINVPKEWETFVVEQQ